MSEDMFDRLRRLGLTRGTRNLKPVTKPASNRASDRGRELHQTENFSLASLLPNGRLEESDKGACFIVDNVYPLKYKHGHSQLYDLLEQEPSSISAYCKEDRLSDLDFRDFVFLDTETTGLYGAGTIAFMVGIAFYERSGQDDVLVVRQFFLRDHEDELAMLQILSDFLASRKGLVTFNGQTFDLPLLENRYLMNRLPGAFRQLPHIDLLPLSRRLWRARFGSVALGNLEKELLAVRRTEADVPGWLIPTIYNDYLRNQDARALKRVFYHNEIDMLSMVSLADRLLRLVSNPTQGTHPVDLYSLGKWQADIGMFPEAEKTLKDVLENHIPLPVFHKVLARLGLLLKQQQRHREAVPYWQQWAATSFEEIDAHLELAKFYEWHDKDLKMAEHWTLEALTLIDSWSRPRAVMIRPELVHRLARIQRKLSL